MIPWIIIRFWFSFTDRTGSHSSGLTTWLPEKGSFQMTDTRQLRTTMASARWVVVSISCQGTKDQTTRVFCLCFTTFIDENNDPLACATVETSSGYVRLRNSAEILGLGPYLFSKIWVRAIIGLFKMPLSIWQSGWWEIQNVFQNKDIPGRKGNPGKESAEQGYRHASQTLLTLRLNYVCYAGYDS